MNKELSLFELYILQMISKAESPIDKGDTERLNLKVEQINKAKLEANINGNMSSVFLIITSLLGLGIVYGCVSSQDKNLAFIIAMGIASIIDILLTTEFIKNLKLVKQLREAINNNIEHHKLEEYTPLILTFKEKCKRLIRKKGEIKDI